MELKSIEKLRKIMKIEGIDRKSGTLAREKALEGWINEELVEVTTSQSVIKTNFTSEEEDFLKYYLATKIGDKLMDDCVMVETSKNKITTKVRALRR